MALGTANEAIADLQKALLPRPEFRRTRSDGVSATHEEELFGLEDGHSLKAPGGFRRHFLHSRAKDVPLAARPAAWRQPLMVRLQPLIRAGHFESLLRTCLDSELSSEDSHRSLIQGTAGSGQTFVALVKSFVGCGILFMPGAFSQGGWLFSSLGLVATAVVSAGCIRLLVECQDRTGAEGFGDIASLAAGIRGKQAVQASLVLSQLGSCVAYIAFIQETSRSLGVSSAAALTAGLVLVLAPLCLIRSVHRLQIPVLLSTALAFCGLGIVIWYNSLALLQESRPQHDLLAFKPQTCGLFLGTATFAFAGIPMMLPIRNAMKEPCEFWGLFVKAFGLVAVLECLFGLAGYSAYGEEVKQVVLLNLPGDRPLALAAKLAYLTGLVCGFPLMFLPAALTAELCLFGNAPKGQNKWRKNILRILGVAACGATALQGGATFERLLALIGALCSAPIAFVYPCVFHIQLCPGGLLLDVSLLVLGLGAMALALGQAI